MSIKRISRMRVATHLTKLVDEDPLATKINIKDDTRTGGDVETKATPTMERSVGGAMQSRVGTNIDTRSGTNGESKYGPKG